MSKTICVYGAASDRIPQEIKQMSYELGSLIAKHGNTLIYGAGATGVMGASAQGASEAGGKVIGVSPRFMDEFQPIECGYCSDLIWTENMSSRKDIMESNADAFIIAPGGIGTYDEFFQALTLKELKRHEKPIIVCNFLGTYDDVLHLINHGIESGFIRESVRGMFAVVEQPEEVLQYL